MDETTKVPATEVLYNSINGTVTIRLSAILRGKHPAELTARKLMRRSIGTNSGETSALPQPAN